MARPAAILAAIGALALARGAKAFSPAARSLCASAAARATSSSSAALRSASDPHLEIRPRAPTDALTSPTLLQKLRLRLGLGKDLRERVVHKYFHGVDTQNIPQIVDCFSEEGATIRDICSLANRDVSSYEEVGKEVTPEFLGERCREFLAAHPDCKVMFRYA